MSFFANSKTMSPEVQWSGLKNKFCLFRQLFESSSDAVILIDRNENIQMLNNAALELLELDKNTNYIGQSIGAVYTPYSRDGNRVLMSIAAFAFAETTKVAPKVDELLLKKHSGEQIELRQQVQQLFDETGTVIGAGITLVNQSVQYKLQTLLTWKNEQIGYFNSICDSETFYCDCDGKQLGGSNADFLWSNSRQMIDGGLVILLEDSEAFVNEVHKVFTEKRKKATVKFRIQTDSLISCKALHFFHTYLKPYSQFGFVCILEDCTEFTNLSNKYHDTNALFQTVMHSPNFILSVRDPAKDFEPVVGNRGFLKLRDAISIDHLMPDEKFYTPETCRKIRIDCINHIQYNTATTRKQKHEKKSGEIMYMDDYISPVKMSNGSTLLVSISYNFTEHYLNQHSLADNQIFLQSILNNLSIPICLMTVPEKQIFLCNDAFFSEIAAYGKLMEKNNVCKFVNRNELENHTIAEILPPEAVATIRESKGPILHLKNLDGTTFKVYSRKVASITNSNGKEFTITSLEDITDNAMKEQKLKQAQAEIVERQRFEAFITGLIEVSTQKKSPPQIRLQNLTKYTCEFFNFSECFVFAVDKNSNSCSVKSKWLQMNQLPEMEDVEPEPDLKEVWFNDLCDSNELELPNLSNRISDLFRKNASSWIPFIKTAKTDTLYLLSINIYGENWGFIACSIQDPNRRLTASEKKQIRSIRHTFESLIAHVRQERIFMESDAMFRQIVDTMPIPMILLNSDLKVERLNAAAKELEPVSKYNFDHYTEINDCCKWTGCPDVSCAGRQTVADMKPHSHEIFLHNKTYRVSTHPIIKDGKIKYVIETMLDVSEEILAKQQFAELNKLRRTFYYAIGRELRTPVSNMIACAELLRSTEQNDSSTEFIKDLVTSGNTLMNLIDDLSMVADLDSSWVPKNEVVSLSEILKNIVNSVFADDIKNNRLKFNVDIESLPEIRIDAFGARQSLVHVIAFLLKAAPSATINVKISFKATALGGILQVKIDTPEKLFPDSFVGCNLTENELYKEGQVAWLATNDLLTLSFACHIIEKIHGSLIYTKDPMPQLTLTFNGLAYTETEEVNAPVAVTLSGNKSSATVLVIDDVAMNLQLMKLMLKNMEVECDCVQNENEALALAKTNSYRQILCDRWLTSTTGEKLAEELHAISPNSLIYLVTADSDDDNQPPSQYISDVLRKPISVEMLEKIIK